MTLAIAQSVRRASRLAKAPDAVDRSSIAASSLAVSTIKANVYSRARPHVSKDAGHAARLLAERFSGAGRATGEPASGAPGHSAASLAKSPRVTPWIQRASADTLRNNTADFAGPVARVGP